MPVVTIDSCTQEAVLDALRACGGHAHYETDNNEALAQKLGFDRSQVNKMFGHLRDLVKAKEVVRTKEDVVPRRFHDRGPCPAIVRRVTFTVATEASLYVRESGTGRVHSPYFVR